MSARRVALILSAFVSLLAAPAAPASAPLTDPTDDVIDAETEAPLAEPRADIVSAAAEYQAAGISFSLQVAQPTDPKTDPGWAGEASGATWVIDVTGDNDAEYLAGMFIGDQSVDEAQGEVVSVADPDREPCPATVAYSASAGYSITFVAACIDSAPSFRWGAVMVYDTDPEQDEAPVGLDIAPNDETFLGPVARAAG